jgi:hypothetical protein
LITIIEILFVENFVLQCLFNHSIFETMLGYKLMFVLFINYNDIFILPNYGGKYSNSKKKIYEELGFR